MLIAILLSIFLTPQEMRAEQRPTAPPQRDVEPALSLEALDKLRDRARASTKRGTIGADVADLLDPGAGACTSRQLVAERAGATHYLSFCLPWETDEIFLFVVRPGATHLYRMDSAPSLRAAARITTAAVERVTAETASDGFQRELAVWEELSKTLADRSARAVVKDASAALTITFLRNSRR